MGFDPQLFVAQPVDENLICDLCLEVLEKPTTACANGHAYCAECLERARERRPHCPGCRNDLLEPATLSRPFSNLIMSQIVRCRNSTSYQGDDEQPPTQRRRTNENGDHSGSAPRARQYCPWQGSLSDYIDTHKDICGYAPVMCTILGCSRLLRQGELAAHLTECPQRLVKCPECNASEKSIDLHRHIETFCPNVMVSCSFCHEEMLRRDLGNDSHLRWSSGEHEVTFSGHYETCPKILLRCCFYDQGCTTVLPREDLAAHYAEKVRYHMMLLSKSLKQMQKETEKKFVNAKNWEKQHMRWAIPTSDIASNNQVTLKSTVVPVASDRVYLKLRASGQQVQVSLCAENPTFSVVVDNLLIRVNIADDTIVDSDGRAYLDIPGKTELTDQDGADLYVCGPLKYERRFAPIDNDDENSEYGFEEVEVTRDSLLAGAIGGSVVILADFSLRKSNEVTVACREVIIES